MFYALHRCSERNLKFCRVCFLILLPLVVGCLGKNNVAKPKDSGAIYYLSATGSDNNAGTSLSEAWRTISKVNETAFKAGDRILLEGNQTFVGNLYLDATNCPNSPENPIKIGSYGEGRATIDGGTGTAIFIYNCGGVEISMLKLIGSGQQLSEGNGIKVFTDLPGDVKLEHIDISYVDVSGFREGGITIEANNGRTGFRNTRITNSKVHDNGDGGISISGFYSAALKGYPNEDVYIAGNKIFQNEGKPGKIHLNTGNGIVVGGSDGAIIEHNVAYNNGAENSWDKGGPVGIWAWDSNDVMIQFNESHHNKTKSIDGGGFDLDGGVSNSIIQYNYSHDNYGAGFLVATFGGARPTKNNIIRYNISENDGRNSGYAGIFLFRDDGIEVGPFEDLKIYNNTIYITPAPGRQLGDPAAFKSVGKDIKNVKVFNNLFVTTRGAKLISKSQGGTDITFQGNNYFSSGDVFKIIDSGITYNSLDAWRSATGQETVDSENVGMTVDPLLINPGAGGNIGDSNIPEALTSYRLQNTSPMINAGLDPHKLFDTDPGARDFYSNPIPQGVSYDIGAHEWSDYLDLDKRH
jgi:hypothetical protein